MTDFKSHEIVKVVDALIGKTTAVGDEAADKSILRNLKNAIDVVNWLFDGIADSAITRHRPEHSMRVAGETAFSAMCEWKEWLEDTIKEVK